MNRGKSRLTAYNPWDIPYPTVFKSTNPVSMMAFGGYKRMMDVS